MRQFHPVSGLQVSVASLMICSAVITLVEPLQKETSAAVQDEIAAPADKRSMEKFMARKLTAAQKALEGVSRNDFDLIRKSSAEMSDLSRHEVWERMASARFVQDTSDFVSAAEFLDRMAASQDVEGVSLGFMRLTMTCANCHSHVRSSNVARLNLKSSRVIADR